MRLRWTTFFALSVAGLAPPLSAQTSSLPDAPAARFAPSNPSAAGQAYTPPTQKQLFRDYLFGVAGPYPIFTASASAGIHMATDSPPEWGQGASAFGKRFASSIGIGTVETTTRFGLGAALKEDTLYYPCECKGVWPRVGHAIFSSFTARRGADGHRVFSIPALAAPYAGTITGTYAWYPSRFGIEDALRMGDNGFFSYVGGNIAIEFLEGGAHPLLEKIHLPIPSGASR
ncbi:MAG TPA: hypothetical protein VLZ50_05490 [Terracidiphilus sp.]|nr:hypothetical protein [Terracidiphilus sp.]